MEGTFNWNTFLLLELDQYSSARMADAYMRSGNWVTCAVGGLCAAILRDKKNHNAPKDDVLYELGLAFHDEISTMSEYVSNDEITSIASFCEHRNKAISILMAIEQRSETVLKELQQTGG